MTSIPTLKLTVILLVSLLAPAAYAQLALPWYTIDGGGGMSSIGGTLSLSGTIGQPDAGVMTGGGLTLTGGFWAATPSTGIGVPAATVTAAVSRKTHLIHGVQDIPINIAAHVQDGNVTSEPRDNGVTELHITFDAAPGGPGPTPITILQHTCSSCAPACNPPGAQAGYVPYSGSAAISAAIQDNDLVLSFRPGLESARTYKFVINADVTSVADQALEVRVMLGDVNSDARTNGGDRSQVISVWTSTNFSPPTDINLDGKTNGGDRSVIVGVWTSAERCAP